MGDAPRLGGRVRTLRRKRGLTQAALAERLGVSASYLNLIEHDRRPLTAPLLIKLAQLFDLDLKTFAAESDARLVSELLEVFGDQLFEGHELSSTDVRELVGGSPAIAQAILTLYQALRESRDAAQSLASRISEEGETPGVVPWRLPSEEVSELIQRHGNYFPALEEVALELWTRAHLDPGDLATRGLVTFLTDELGVQVQVVKTGSEGRAVRRYDPETKVLRLSEVLPPRTRNFHLAHQIALILHPDLLDRIAGDHRLTTDDSRTLCRMAMANYFAGAVLMPYDRFLDAARIERYDLEMLGHRFRTSFEQVAHRLTCLHKSGAEGVPFHFVRVDLAGNIDKRFSASGMRFPRFSAACPKWNVHAAFQTPGQIRVQIERMPDGTAYFTMARTVTKGAGGFHAPQNVHAIALGCEVRFARELVYADGVDLDSLDAAVDVGVTCRTCERMDCEQRAFPPVQRALQLDENARALSFYTPVKD